jgi:hypothetical protein
MRRYQGCWKILGVFSNVIPLDLEHALNCKLLRVNHELVGSAASDGTRLACYPG